MAAATSLVIDISGPVFMGHSVTLMWHFNANIGAQCAKRGKITTCSDLNTIIKHVHHKSR